MNKYNLNTNELRNESVCYGDENYWNASLKLRSCYKNFNVIPIFLQGDVFKHILITDKSADLLPKLGYNTSKLKCNIIIIPINTYLFYILGECYKGESLFNRFKHNILRPFDNYCDVNVKDKENIEITSSNFKSKSVFQFNVDSVNDLILKFNNEHFIKDPLKWLLF